MAEKKNTVEIVKADNPRSKQVKDNDTRVGTRIPKIPFSTLLNLYYDSFVVSWLTDKISTAISSGFDTKDDKLLTMLNTIDHEFLNRNKVLCGNAFFEVIRDGKGSVLELVPVLSNTIEIMNDWDGYKQSIGTKVTYFNEFTPLADRVARTALWTESKAGEKELVNTGKWCGFNPNLNEIYHFKNTSLDTKYYGASYFESAIDQIVLIEQIDSYYSKAFDNGMIKAKILFSKSEKKGFSKDDKTALKEFLKAKMKGLDKAFSTAIVDNEVWFVDLEHEIDANAFIEYRQQLLKAVAISLNIPYDMILSDNSNRASSQVSMESFNKFTIAPFQAQNVRDFKILFQDNKYTNLDTLKYDFIDTKDQKEDMEVLTGFKKAGVMTANEVREKLGLKPLDGWDELVVDSQAQQKDQLTDLMKKEETSFYQYLTQIDHDISKDL